MKKMIKSLAITLTMALAFSTPVNAAKNKLVKKSGNYYFYNSKGKKITGWKTVKGKKYYFDKKTKKAVKGYKMIGKKFYHFNKSGQLSGSGLKKIKGKLYYFSKGIAKKGIQKIGKKTYYFTSDYSAYKGKGWKKIGNKKYYFNGYYATKSKKVKNDYSWLDGWNFPDEEETEKPAEPVVKAGGIFDGIYYNTKGEATSKAADGWNYGVLHDMRNCPRLELAIAKEINNFRVANGRSALEIVPNDSSVYKITKISTCYNVYKLTIGEHKYQGQGYNALAKHFGASIGTAEVLGFGTRSASENTTYHTTVEERAHAIVWGGWATSPPHKANMLAKNAKYLAVSVTYLPDNRYRSNENWISFKYSVNAELAPEPKDGIYFPITEQEISLAPLIPYNEWQVYLDNVGEDPGFPENQNR